jgi:hypothetical protein
MRAFNPTTAGYMQVTDERRVAAIGGLDTFGGWS